MEVFSYRLTMQGKSVGSQILTMHERGFSIFLEAKMQLQGALGNLTVTQQSKVHKEKFSSYFFNEETQDSKGKRQFNVTFDYQKGLVRASRSAQDKAEIPLILAFSDPLSLLYQLRQFKAGETVWHIPMLGKTVTVERIGEKTLDTVFGERLCYVYKLWPGASYVYIAKEAPHQIMMMTQRFDGRSLDAQLIKLNHENPRPTTATVASQPQRRRPKRPARKAAHKQN